MSSRGACGIAVALIVLATAVLVLRESADLVETQVPNDVDSRPLAESSSGPPDREGAQAVRDPGPEIGNAASEVGPTSCFVEVVSLEGEPVPNARVTLREPGSSEEAGTTDSAGRLAVALERLLDVERVAASHSDFATHEVFVPHGTSALSVVVIRLPRKGFLRVRTVTSDGVGVPGMRIAVWPDGFLPPLGRLCGAVASPNAADPEIRLGTSDGDGYCEFHDVPADRSFTAYAAGNGHASKYQLIAHSASSVAAALAEQDPLVVVPIYGVVTTLVRTDGSELPVGTLAWSSEGWIDVFDDGLDPESFGNPFALCLLGLNEQEVYHWDEPGGALVRWLAQPSVPALRGAIGISLPGYAQRTEEFRVPRIDDRLERRPIVVEPAPGVAFANVAVTLRIGRRFDRTATRTWSRSPFGEIYLHRIDEGDTANYAYPLLGIFDAPQNLRGISCGRYEMWAVLPCDAGA